jgi:hypothetical protein
MDLRYLPREVEGRDDEIKLHDVVATLLEVAHRRDHCGRSIRLVSSKSL